MSVRLVSQCSTRTLPLFCGTRHTICNVSVDPSPLSAPSQAAYHTVKRHGKQVLHMSLMQRPAGSSCCSRPCQLRPRPPFYTCCLHVKAVPAALPSRLRRVATCGSAREVPGNDAAYSAQWDAVAAEVQLARLPRERTSLQAALVQAVLNIIGGTGVLLFAFGRSLCTPGQLTRNPYFPTGLVALFLVIHAACSILGSFLDPLDAYHWWKHEKRLCVKYWGRELVEDLLKVHAITDKSDNSSSFSMLRKGQEPLQIDPNLGHLKLHERLHDRVLPDIRRTLLQGLLDKHQALVEALDWGSIRLIGAFAVYKCFVDASSPYHLAWLQSDATISMPLYLLSMLLQCKLSLALFKAIGGVMSAYTNLKFHEQDCVRWCGKDSIKPTSKHRRFGPIY